jgi:hypothetical protein
MFVSSSSDRMNIYPSICICNIRRKEKKNVWNHKKTGTQYLMFVSFYFLCVYSLIIKEKNRKQKQFLIVRNWRISYCCFIAAVRRIFLVGVVEFSNWVRVLLNRSFFFVVCLTSDEKQQEEKTTVNICLQLSISSSSRSINLFFSLLFLLFRLRISR